MLYSPVHKTRFSINIFICSQFGEAYVQIPQIGTFQLHIFPVENFDLQIGWPVSINILWGADSGSGPFTCCVYISGGGGGGGLNQKSVHHASTPKIYTCIVVKLLHNFYNILLYLDYHVYRLYLIYMHTIYSVFKYTTKYKQQKKCKLKLIVPLGTFITMYIVCNNEHIHILCNRRPFIYK